MVGKCGKCGEHIAHKDYAIHTSGCSGAVSEAVEWVWEEGAGARRRGRGGENDEAANNIEASMSLLAGKENIAIASRMQAGMHELVVTFSDGDETDDLMRPYGFKLIMRYGPAWPKDAAVGMQRTTTRVTPSAWRRLCALTTDAATAQKRECLEEDDDELNGFCYNLVMHVHEQFMNFHTAEKKNLHDNMMSKAQGDTRVEDLHADPEKAVGDNVGRTVSTMSTLSQNPVADDAASGMLQSLRNLRSSRAPLLMGDIGRNMSNESGSGAESGSAVLSPEKAPQHPARPQTCDALPVAHVKSEVTEVERSPSPGRSEPSHGDTASPSESGSDVDALQGDAASSSNADSSDSSGSDTDESSSDGSSSSSSSSGGRFDWGKVQRQQQKEAELAAQHCEALNVHSRETTRTHGVSTASIITPPERRRFTVLRHLLLMADEEEHYKQAIIDSLVNQGVLRCLPPKDRDDLELEAAIDKILAQGITADADADRRPCAESSRDQQASSWFLRNFKVTKQLGKGGQGRVFLVQNNYDRLFYAVKRVVLLPTVAEEGEKDRQRVEQEIYTLARMRHRSIVRYFIAWFEEESRDKRGMAQWHALAGIGGSDTALDSTAFTMSSATDTAVTLNTYGGGSPPLPDEGATQTVVYIQMEYCDQETLRQALDLRVPGPNGEDTGVFLSETECGLKILFQLLECVDYIHQQGVIHRDLKPENIFFDLVSQPSASGRYFAGNIKVGDFGLATATNDDLVQTPTAEYGVDAFARGAGGRSSGAADGLEYSVGIGTPLYAAPEQEMRSDYDSKVDEYSVGIIAYEMFSGFSSRMERHRHITELRRTGKVPEDWVGRSVHLNLVNVIEALVARNPAERATARDVLPSLPKPQSHTDMLEAVDMLVDDHNRLEMTRLLHARMSRNVNQLNSLDWQHYLDSLPTRGARACPPLHVHAHGATMVKEAIASSVRLAGCIEVNIDPMVPCSALIKDVPSFNVTDTNGNLLMVPLNPCVSFARWLSLPRSAPLPLPLRRYGVSRIPEAEDDGAMHAGTGAAVAAAWSEVVSFDFVNAAERLDPQVNRMLDAEVLLLVAGVLQSLPALSTSQTWLIRVNHVHILAALAALVGKGADRPTCPLDELVATYDRCQPCTPAVFAKAFGLDDKLAGKLTRLLQQRYYAAGTGHASGDERSQTSEDFVQLASSMFGIKQQLANPGRHDKNGALAQEHKDIAVDGLREMQRLVAVLQEQQFQQRHPNVTVVLDPVLRDETRAYCGLLWTAEIALKDRRQVKTKGLRVGLGGRYSAVLDDLRRHYKLAADVDVDVWRRMAKIEMHHISEGMEVCATGGYLAVTRISEALWRLNLRPTAAGMGSTLFVHMRRNYSAKLLLQIANKMRTAGVSTEYQLDPHLDEASLRESCKAVNIQWLLRVHVDNMADFEKGREPTMHFRLTKVTSGGLLKQRSEKESFEFDAELATVAKRVGQHISGGNAHVSSSSTAAAAHTHTTHMSPSSASGVVKVFGGDGKPLSSAAGDRVHEAIAHTFKDAPPSRCCVVTDVPAAEVRDTVSHMYQTAAAGSGDGWNKTRKLLADVIRDKAAVYLPVLLVYSERDEQFECVMCSSIQSKHHKGYGHDYSTTSFTRSDKGGRVKNERKGKKQR